MRARDESRTNEARTSRERYHFDAIARRQMAAPLVMPWSNVRRYQSPSSDAPYPLEYAFHLAGELRGRSVIEIGSGDGLNTVLLAALGANMVAVDISEESIRLSTDRARANRVEESP